MNSIRSLALQTLDYLPSGQIQFCFRDGFVRSLLSAPFLQIALFEPSLLLLALLENNFGEQRRAILLCELSHL
ncbi:hypothetical protein NL529_29810, partial [Klebsiella pneumoniae]|nr:hypothetical protein [Klebsiella pneumoniae]